jgi:glycosyl hydrolase family 123
MPNPRQSPFNYIVATAFWLVVAFVFGNLDAYAGPTVWVVSALTRISREESPANSMDVALWAARGEYESFQVVVRAPAGGLTNVKVAASALAGEGKRVIPKSNLALFREHYVHVTRGSPDRGGYNRPLGPGWYPDALIPFPDGDTKVPASPGELKAIPFNLAAATNQPVWVDVFVPHNAEPGVYRGAITVSSDQGGASVPVAVNVWNFGLPLSPSLHSVFGIYNDTASNPHVYYADLKANQRLLLEHKLMPVSVDPAAEREFIDRFGLNLSQLEFFKVASYGSCQQPPAPAVADLLALKGKHQPDLSLYVHLADEVSECRRIFPVLKQWSKNVRAAGLLAQLTAIPLPELRDDGSGSGRSVADIWVMLPKQIVSNSADMTVAMNKGDQVWSYTALVQDSYSPKWAIDFAPINYRILGGFLNQVQGLSGLLYWNVNSWVIDPTPDPWNNVTYIEDGKPTPPGEGWLVYPGGQAGAAGLLPSMRLKWIRKSVEDYEYIEILKRLGRGEWALGIARTVAPDWANWTRDPNALESARRQFGDEISRLMSSRPASAAPARP